MDEKQIFLSADLAHRLAAIDIGSNSARLMVAEPLRGGNYRILDEEREPTRLGRTLGKKGSRLDPEAVELTLAALRRFKQIAAGYQVDELRTIATCAVREAADGAEFCRRTKEEIGLDIEVVTADQEARLAFFSVQRAFDLTGKNVVVADIGGGSTELVFASGNVIESISSTSLGAVRLTEMFSTSSAVSSDEIQQLISSIDRMLKKQASKPFFTPHLLIGSGGTFTSMAEMMMAARKQVGLPVRGYLLTRAEVTHLLDRLRKMPVKARRQVPGLVPDRADIIVAGIAIVDRLMRRFNVNLLQVHSRGVRDGLVLTMIDKTLGPSGEAVDRDAAIDRFAAACSGEHELAHGKQVSRLAGRLFDQLAERFELLPTDRPLLETAARLQDVGYLINYDQHHKHSYHLILNSRLAGFRPRELEIIANVARYHRGARPKLKHANFRQLSADDRRRVEQLASILRLAGGLDRSHSQQVKDLSIRAACDAAAPLELVIHADANPEVDLWGARRRAKFFQKVFHTRMEILWDAPPDAANTPMATARPGDRTAAASPPANGAPPAATNGQHTESPSLHGEQAAQGDLSKRRKAQRRKPHGSSKH